MEQINNEILIIICKTRHVIFHITDISLNGTTEIINASTKSGSDMQAGEKTLNVFLSGKEFDVTAVEHQPINLSELNASKATIEWKIVTKKLNSDGTGIINEFDPGLIRISGKDSNNKYSVKILLEY